MKETVLVLIIAHKDCLTQPEVASLRQCYKIFANHPIKLICPEGLNISVYKSIISNAEIVFIDSKWQSTYRMFNELKKNQLLYKKFKNYKYILFYELDAWSFRDELNYWCNKGYDYIGAPWLDTTTEEIIGVGNGGFSLRKVDSAIRITKRMIFLQRLRSFWFKSHFQAIIRFPRVVSYFQKYLKIRNMEEVNIIHCASYPNEDHYWSILSNFFTDYNVAPNDDAMHFSFEANPSLLYKKNNYRLPFGCHGWQKYQPDFWREHIYNSISEI